MGGKKRNECIVAFIDIIGSSSILCSDDREDIIQFVEGLSGIYGKLYEKYDMFFIKTFSDNLLIWSEDCSEAGVVSFINSLAYIQYEVLREFKLILRGGVVIDDLHWDSIHDNDDFVIGKSIVRAYRLESKKAQYPRIILSNKDFQRFFPPDDNNDSVITDREGRMYVNYLQTTLKEEFPDEEMVAEHANIIKERISRNLVKIKDEEWEKIYLKDVWTIRYHNDFCARYELPCIRFKEEKVSGMEKVIIKFDDT